MFLLSSFYRKFIFLCMSNWASFMKRERAVFNLKNKRKTQLNATNHIYTLNISLKSDHLKMVDFQMQTPLWKFCLFYHKISKRCLHVRLNSSLNMLKQM